MTNLHANFYADSMTQVESPIEVNQEIADGTFLVRLRAPKIATAAVPGQFVMIRIAGLEAPLIGRAFAIWEIHDGDSGPEWIDLVYLRKGKLTTALASCPVGTSVGIWGPLGNGFSARPCDRLIMAAGGIGQTPMLLLGREAIGGQGYGSKSRPSGWAKRVELVYGARTSGLLAGVEDFREAGIDVTLCTDDGSAGSRRRVPEVLAERLSEIPEAESVRVVTCGPEIMMEKVAEVCAGRQIDCQVSMETPMACGIGICFSCVARVRQAPAESSVSEDSVCWDYKRTCVEGPIFDATEICW